MTAQQTGVGSAQSGGMEAHPKQAAAKPRAKPKPKSQPAPTDDEDLVDFEDTLSGDYDQEWGARVLTITRAVNNCAQMPHTHTAMHACARTWMCLFRLLCAVACHCQSSDHVARTFFSRGFSQATPQDIPRAPSWHLNLASQCCSTFALGVSTQIRTPLRGCMNTW